MAATADFVPTEFDPEPFLRAIDDDRGTFVEFAQAFLASYDTTLAAIATAAEARDAQALRDRAHAFKGSLAIFRADPIIEVLEAVDELCREHPDQVDAAAIVPLAAPARAFAAELARYCDTLRVPLA